MRKKVFKGMLLAALFCLMSSVAMADGVGDGYMTTASQVVNPILSGANDMPDDARSITVYLIVGTNAGVSKNAHYSPSENRIYIKEGKYLMNYNVLENPQYGQDSAKGRYKYRASDYFFNL